MPGFNRDSTGATEQNVVFADNVDFSGSVSPAPKVTTNGQLLIGSTATPNIQVGSLTSPLATLTIGYSSPNITIDLAGSGVGIDSIGVDVTTGAGTNPVLPNGSGLVTFTGGQYPTGTFGTRVITLVSTAANTLAAEVQISAANASSVITKNGVAHFDSTSFAVDANGFVTLVGGGFSWSDVSGAFSPLKDNGYFITATATGTLPAAPSQGDTIEFLVDHASQVLTIQATGSQVIRIGTAVSAAAGTAVSTARGDSVQLVYRASNTSWNCVSGSQGTWTVT